MNAKQFLQIGGAVLLLVGILGFVGVLGPTPDKSLFGDTWWFDNGENWAHTILGIVALAASMWFAPAMQKPLVIVVGLVALFFGIYNFFSDSFMGANLEQHADTVLHLAVGAWALWAAMSTKDEEAK